VQENLSTIKTAFIDCFGKEWYSRLQADEQNKIYIKVVLNREGKIVHILEYKLFHGMTKMEYKKFSRYLVEKSKFCVYNPEAEISFERYVKIYRGRLPYKIVFIPFVFKNESQ
jgi:hypothetical protein